MTTHTSTAQATLALALAIALSLTSVTTGQENTTRDTARSDAQRAQASWPQWRGPARDGISRESTWSIKSKAKSVWFTNVGIGYSMPSISNGRLYTIGHDEEAGEDSVYCIDAKTGVDIWEHSYKSRTMNRGHAGGCLTTPSLDGDRLYIANREGKLLCLDAKTGKPRWTKDLRTEHGLRLPTWGYSASPLVLRDRLVQAMGYVFAFDREGKQLWKSEKNYGDAYSTPVDFVNAERKLVACFHGAGLAILDLNDGREIATHAWGGTGRRMGVHAVTPIVIDGKRIFITSGRRGCQMLDFVDDKLTLAWESRDMRANMSTCVVIGKHIYGLDNSTFKCLDLDGKEVWAERGFGQGSFAAAGDRLIILSSRGDCVVAKATHEGYEELSRRNILGGGVYWTAPVLCGGHVFARNSLGDMICLDHRGE